MNIPKWIEKRMVSFVKSSLQSVENNSIGLEMMSQLLNRSTRPMYIPNPFNKQIRSRL